METIVFVNLILGSTLSALLEQKRFLISIAVGAFFGLILNLILIPRYGFVGAGITAIITQLIIFGFLYYFVSSKIASIPLLSFLWRPALGSAVMAAAVIYLSWLPLWWLTLIGMAVYFAVVYILGGIERSDITLAAELTHSAGKLSVSKITSILRKKRK